MEIDRLCDFKYSLREMKDKYVHIVKEPIPILVMQLIDFQIPQFMNEIKYSDEELSKAGEYNIILNSKGQAECITKTTKVYLTKFSDITDAHAYKEGEGDKSLSYWKNIHERFFNECLTSYNEKITSDDLIVCEEFELVYKVD